ncbi:MAG TPA: AAA family ATPase, partial [Anaerolineaceae bacterium]|nr:AAA family ATPase [Anaerolineaceae bacterium]
MPPRLKSLELHGYKTFASRTNFEFPGIITAIVGPNGSGKSNIADSLRWVLGEQSYMLLRGRKTEDMIFSGSELRPRSGMASATITFDNSDGWLPIDFSEVSIMRRAYRDGQNEYLLNGQKVRLREISELLAQSGLAERTYTIIGQGLVDAALSLKPEERRRLFEEAAGIGLYRSRREDAINRLENTRRNLDRVQDILAELEPRLQSLEKQARRAQEYERIKADLHLLLREWYGFHWHRQQKELAHAREALKAQENRLEQARQRQAEVNEQISIFRAEMNELRQKLNGWHTESAQIHQQMEKLSRSLAILEERQRSLIEQRQNGKNDLVRLEEELAANQKRLESVEEDQGRLQEEFVEAQKHVDIARQALSNRQAERSKAEKDLREARQRLTAVETRQVQLNAHQNELAARFENEQKSLENNEQLIKAGAVELELAQARLEEAERGKKAAEKARKEKQAALAEFRQQMKEHETLQKNATLERSRLESERARVQAQIDVLEQAERSFTGMGDGARFLLQASKQEKVSGKFRSLITAMVVPAEYETAVSAALGEYLDAIVVDGIADLEQALQLLESGKKGRAALLPVSQIRPLDRLTPPSDPDSIGLAADLVQVPADHRALADLVLGQVVIVKSRGGARRLVEKIPPTAKVVTLRGEVFHGIGSVISGQETRSGSGTLSRPRQKQELQSALDGVHGKIRIIEAEQIRLEEEQTHLQKRERQLEEEIRETGMQAEKLGEAFHQAALAAEQIRRH